ncbi:MAG: hypothetical protein JHC89_05440 [Acetobacteraceae bacterium]|nr:hypothetical protein [Acetobacteraceae bacterium]
MTELLYREDAYAAEISAKVLAASAEAIVTDRTNFYAQAGGQPSDTGVLRWPGGEARIANTTKGPEDTVLHVPEAGAANQARA